MRVKCINDFNSNNFTTDKEYDCIRTNEGLQIIDDFDEEHIIAKETRPNNGYENDKWFRSRFVFINNLELKQEYLM